MDVNSKHKEHKVTKPSSGRNKRRRAKLRELRELKDLLQKAETLEEDHQPKRSFCSVTFNLDNRFSSFTPTRRPLTGTANFNIVDDSGIDDEHLNAIIAAGPRFCQTIVEFRSRDPTPTNDQRLSEAAVLRFAQACPNLIHVAIEGSYELGDGALLALLRNCPKIQTMELSGHTATLGRVEGKIWRRLAKRDDLGKDLTYLRLVNQSELLECDPLLRGLSKWRPRIEIVVGNDAGCITSWRGGTNSFVKGKSYPAGRELFEHDMFS